MPCDGRFVPYFLLYTVDWLRVTGNEIICFSQICVTVYNKRSQNPYILDNKTGRGEKKTWDKNTNNSEEEWNREEGRRIEKMHEKKREDKLGKSFFFT